jgi:hypothetical protein
MNVGEGMRHARLRGEPEAEAAYYHCISRIVDRRFVLEAREKEIFVRMMRGYEAFTAFSIGERNCITIARNVCDTQLIGRGKFHCLLTHQSDALFRL